MNPRSNKVNINLGGFLDLTRNKVDVTQYANFEEKNSPVYGESLSPLFQKKVENNNYAVFDSKGHKYTYVDNVLYKDDSEVMRTKGSGYFSIREVTDPIDWDTYDIWNGHVAKSKYEAGTVKYYYDGAEYTWSASSVANSIVACRTRIIEGVPITAYVFATPTANVYQFVLLSRTAQYASLGNTAFIGAWSSQWLATPANGGSVQNRSAEITVSRGWQGGFDKGFLNPLIQIAQPIAGVYVVSFISNHGGKINTHDELRFKNIVWNANYGTFYEDFGVDLSGGSTADIPYSRNLSMSARPSISKSEWTGTCYAYHFPSGDPAWDAAHQADAGKYFTRVGQGNVLLDEITFDQGYTPTWTYDSGYGGVIYYSSFAYVAHNDTLSITVQASGIEAGDYVQPILSYTPKMKITVNEEVYTFRNKTYQTYADDNLLLYTRSGSSYVPVYKKKLILNTGTDKEIYTPNNKNAYQYMPKWNSSYQDNSYLSSTSYYVRLVSGAYNDPVYRATQKPNTVIRRDIHSTVDKDGNPIPDGTILNYDQYPVEYTSTAAYHEATVGEVWNGTTIATEAETYELDVNGNRVQADVSYYRTIYGFGDVYEPMSFEDAQPYVDTPQKLVSYNSGAEAQIDLHNTLYRTYYEIKPATRWSDGQSAYFVDTFYANGAVTWTYTYYNNNIDFDPNVLWGGFENAITVNAKAGGATAESFTTDVLDVTAGAPLLWQHDFDWVVQTPVSQATIPDVVLDNGTFVWVGNFPRYNWTEGAEPFVFPLNTIFTFQARADYMVNANTFHFIATGYYHTGVDPNTPGCVLSNTIDIGPNYYRTVINMTNATGSANGAVVGMQVLYDSATQATYVDAGGLSNDATSANGWYDAKYYNTQGSIAAKGDGGKWRYLYNSAGLLSGLSYGEDGYIGTLLTEWNSIADDHYVYGDQYHLGWHSTDGRWYEITEHANATNANISIIFDRYIIVPTNGFWNCYDIERSSPLHYATDFNNRVLAGVSQQRYGLDSAFQTANAATVGYKMTKMFTSGINAMYEVSGVAVTSVQISPQPYINLAVGYENFIWCRADPSYMPQKIEVFYGSSSNSTTADYQYSMSFYGSTSIMTKDPNLVGLVSPVAVNASTYYSPNIFTEFIHTYNNKDLVKNGSYGYPIVYNETTPILSYSSGKQLSNVDAVFVIQSQFYALIGGKIVSIVYDDYTVIGIDAIIDISGMKYLGYLPTKAYFWSQANRSLYSFTGDANLSLEMEANSISEIYKTFYSTQKEALFIATDRGTYVIADIQMYHIDTGHVKDIWFVNDGYFVVETVDNKLTYYSYEHDLIPINDGEVIEKVPVHVETKYYGPGNGQVVVVDKVSVQLRADSFEEGSVDFSCATLTDTGFKSETKHYKINAKDIDKDNNAFMINYTPKWCQGQGFKVDIVSDFPIARVTESVQELIQNTSTKHNL